MSKLFTVAGFSTKEGKVKPRFANGTAAARIRVLERDGHTAISLFDLPKPMDKDEALAYARAALKGAAPVLTVVPKAAAKPVKTVEIKQMTAKERSEIGKTKDEIAKIKSDRLVLMRQVAKRLDKMRDIA
jgi:hypothetical protein